MSVSQKEIAQHLGVSQALVGMALNCHPRISATTRARVENAANELGYDRDLNSGARQMAAKRHGLRILNNVIAVCSNPGPSPVHHQPFESEILDGIESEAEKCGLDVLMCRLRTNKLPRLIEKREVDGLILLSSKADQLKALQALGIPVVKLGSSYSTIHSVSAQHYNGTLLATSHLIHQGHQKIAFIGHDITGGEDESALLDAAKKRFAAFKAAMRHAKLSTEFVDCSLRNQFPEEGGKAFRHLWKKSRGKITAVVCYNDIFAMGVIQMAKKMGLEVPHDLSVVGFDDISSRFRFEHFITSVGYNRVLMGKRAVQILLQYRQGNIVLTGDERGLISEELPVHFVEGATTAAPRAKKI
jgi:DNA-binding LacI/PurR family transcriptional regulator